MSFLIHKNISFEIITKWIFKSVLRNAATNKLKPPYLQVQFFKYTFKI